jgi:hypothetical protein
MNVSERFILLAKEGTDEAVGSDNGDDAVKDREADEDTNWKERRDVVSKELGEFDALRRTISPPRVERQTEACHKLISDL